MFNSKISEKEEEMHCLNFLSETWDGFSDKDLSLIVSSCFNAAKKISPYLFSSSFFGDKITDSLNSRYHLLKKNSLTFLLKDYDAGYQLISSLKNGFFSINSSFNKNLIDNFNFKKEQFIESSIVNLSGDYYPKEIDFEKINFYGYDFSSADLPGFKDSVSRKNIDLLFDGPSPLYVLYDAVLSHAINVYSHNNLVNVFIDVNSIDKDKFLIKKDIKDISLSSRTIISFSDNCFKCLNEDENGPVIDRLNLISFSSESSINEKNLNDLLPVMNHMPNDIL